MLQLCNTHEFDYVVYYPSHCECHWEPDNVLFWLADTLMDFIASLVLTDKLFVVGILSHLVWLGHCVNAMAKKKNVICGSSNAW